MKKVLLTTGLFVIASAIITAQDIPQPGFGGSAPPSPSYSTPQPQFQGPPPSESRQRAYPPTYHGIRCDRWQYIDPQHFFLCRGDTPVYLVECLDAFIYPTSKIQLLGSDKKIMIDGEVEEITNVTKL